jgi:hypothetical protein
VPGPLWPGRRRSSPAFARRHSPSSIRPVRSAGATSVSVRRSAAKAPSAVPWETAVALSRWARKVGPSASVTRTTSVPTGLRAPARLSAPPGRPACTPAATASQALVALTPAVRIRGQLPGDLVRRGCLGAKPEQRLRNQRGLLSEAPLALVLSGASAACPTSGAELPETSGNEHVGGSHAFPWLTMGPDTPALCCR